MKKEYDIFISYRREGGKEYARNLTSELVSRGFHPFLDFDELKDGKFDKRITDAIESAPVFMFILSPGSLDRCVNEDDWVRKEILHAIEHKRHIVPVDIDKQFDAFPSVDDFPQAIKDALGQHQFSQIQTETLYKVSIDEMVKNRIQPAIDEYMRERQKAAGMTGAEIHIETDMDCHVQRFHKDLIIAKANEENVIYLPKGKHKLQFIPVSHSDIVESIEYKVEDVNESDFIELSLRGKTINHPNKTALSNRNEDDTTIPDNQTIKESNAANPVECKDESLEQTDMDVLGVKTRNQSESNKQKSFRWCFARRVRSKMLPDAIDLGLPSGTKWANKNIGARKVTDYGDYFAWGETAPMEVTLYGSRYPRKYKWENEKGNENKYCLEDVNGFIDNKEILDKKDDAANVQWGGNWRMPTSQEIDELISECLWICIDNYNKTGVRGYIVFKVKDTAHRGMKYLDFDSNPYPCPFDYSLEDTHIFLPFAGSANNLNMSESNDGFEGHYWSCSLDKGHKVMLANCFARCLKMEYGEKSRTSFCSRTEGLSIRPVIPSEL